MLPIQIVLIFFFIFAIGKVVGRVRAKEVSPRAAIFWLVFWLAAGVIVVVPDTTSTIAKWLGVGRGADVVVYVALAILFFVLFRLVVRQQRLERDLTRLVRELAFKDKDSHV